MLRKLTERVVYRFLAWFESFDSVWQTTLLCVGVGVFEIGWPNVDRHLIAVLIVSLYATFTQNGLAHENKLTSNKVDKALYQIGTAQAKTDAAVATILATAKTIHALVEVVKTDIAGQEILLEEIAEVHEHVETVETNAAEEIATVRSRIAKAIRDEIVEQEESLSRKRRALQQLESNEQAP